MVIIFLLILLGIGGLSTCLPAKTAKFIQLNIGYCKIWEDCRKLDVTNICFVVQDLCIENLTKNQCSVLERKHRNQHCTSKYDCVSCRCVIEKCGVFLF